MGELTQEPNHDELPHQRTSGITAHNPKEPNGVKTFSVLTKSMHLVQQNAVTLALCLLQQQLQIRVCAAR